MISIREQQYGLDIALFNEFTLADFKRFEEALLKRHREQGSPHILLDLTELKDFTIDMALEELRFVRAHEHAFGHIAIIVSDIWIRVATHIASLFIHSDIKYFPNVQQAQEWMKEWPAPTAP